MHLLSLATENQGEGEIKKYSSKNKTKKSIGQINHQFQHTPDMDTGTVGATPEDLSSTVPAAAAASRWTHAVSIRFQRLLDKSTPFVLHRWLAFAAVAIVYAVRVCLVQGFYIVSYALGIYLINLLIAFLSPQVDPDLSDGGPSLPTRGSDEFRPFVRRLPEFKFWYSMTKAFCIAFMATFFRIFDIPVFWPILLFYWVLLFTLTMKKQILHMVKHRYVPFSFGKRRYDVRAAASTESASLLPRD